MECPHLPGEAEQPRTDSSANRVPLDNALGAENPWPPIAGDEPRTAKVPMELELETAFATAAACMDAKVASCAFPK